MCRFLDHRAELPKLSSTHSVIHEVFLSIVVYLAILASTHQTPIAPPFSLPAPSHDNKKCLQTITNICCLGGQISLG